MRRSHRGALWAGAGVAILALSALGAASGEAGESDQSTTAAHTTTPIKHLVVIFQENISFDHYFGTYPVAANPAGEPQFQAKDGTPTVNGLSVGLLTANPNLTNPQRLDRSQALTCDQGHEYTPEQNAFDHGAMDKFVQSTSSGSPAHPKTLGECLGQAATPADYAVMDYYDGNTVTALWQYAQNFAMSDNSFQTGFGPSTPGVIDLVTGNTFGSLCGPAHSTYVSPGACPAKTTAASTPGSPQAQGMGTNFSDNDPNFDTCSGGPTIQQGGTNVGDLLSAKSVTWGWFQGGFASPGYVSGKPSTDNLALVCTGAHYNLGAGASDGLVCVPNAPTDPLKAFCVGDYSAHHQPFQYYRSTSNPMHLPPTSIDNIGSQDQANHQYDLADFWAAVKDGHMPAVSYLKAAKFQDGHAGYSDPLDEQHFLVDTINRLQKSSAWKNTAVVIAYDDSDGWYDHQMGPIQFQSQTALDSLTGAGQCGASADRVPGGQEARCGYGPRLPMLVISPFSKTNFVDHNLTDQSSVLRFVEDNWGLSRIGNGSSDAVAGSISGMFAFGEDQNHARKLILDPITGQPSHH